MKTPPDHDALYTRLMRYALWLLGRRSYTVKGLSDKLCKKLPQWAPEHTNSLEMTARVDAPQGPDDVDRVLTRLKELRFLNDPAFCERWVEERTRLRPRGRRVLDQELAKKGIPRAVRIEFWDSPLGKTFDEREAARRALEKHLPRLQRKAQGHELKQKCFMTLMRQGFSMEVTKSILQESLPRI